MIWFVCGFILGVGTVLDLMHDGPVQRIANFCAEYERQCNLAEREPWQNYRAS